MAPFNVGNFIYTFRSRIGAWRLRHNRTLGITAHSPWGALRFDWQRMIGSIRFRMGV